MSHKTVMSFGGGVQTAALAVLAVSGGIERPDAIIFADPGSEDQRTYDFIDVLDAWLRERGAEISTHRAKTPLIDKLRAGKIVVPAYGDRMGQLNRVCTERWKIRVVRSATRALGATTADVMLGISMDEVHRAKDSDVKWARNVFPLLDLRMTRRDCERVIQDAGLPIPPKSACTFCPMRTPYGWARLRAENPAAFDEACELEAGWDGVYLSSQRKPLPVVAAEAGTQTNLIDEDEGACMSGHCFA